MRAFVIVFAVAFDWLFGDPPNALHPVAWFGRFVHALERRAPRENPRAELLYGVGIAASGIALAALPALALERVSQSRRQDGLSLLVIAAAFKFMLAWRSLIQAGERVQRDLESGQIAGARSHLSALVSRETAQLDPPLIAAAAIESLAENASDSFIAALFYYQLFGLPGAFVYRAVNTMDAMLGYHGRYEFLGKISARLDDALNLIPSRITALLIALAAPFAGGQARRASETMRRDHARTPSPNAGYPMSAMAGALDIRLEKAGHYRLNQSARPPRPDDIRRAAVLVSVALGLGAAVSFLIQWLYENPAAARRV